MHSTYTSNLVLWGVQDFLPFFFLSASAPKLLGRGLERWTGFSALPRAQVAFIGKGPHDTALAPTVGAR